MPLKQLAVIINAKITSLTTFYLPTQIKVLSLSLEQNIPYQGEAVGSRGYGGPTPVVTVLSSFRHCGTMEPVQRVLCAALRKWTCILTTARLQKRLDKETFIKKPIRMHFCPTPGLINVEGKISETHRCIKNKSKL